MKIVSLLLAGTLLGAATQSALAAPPLKSTSTLSGAQEVPAVATDGTARAFIQFDSGLSEMRVRFTYRDLTGNPTRLHLHCNFAGANGPVALGLVDTVAPEIDNSDSLDITNGVIRGRLTNENFPASDSCLDVIGRPINNIASLAAAIDAGWVYWNLHTDAYPAGEIRGQAMISD